MLASWVKPIANETRKMLPFGSPKRDGQHDQRGEAPEEKRSQIDPPLGRTDARVHRRGLRRKQSMLGPPGYMDGSASLASIPPPTALREAR